MAIIRVVLLEYQDGPLEDRRGYVIEVCDPPPERLEIASFQFEDGSRSPVICERSRHVETRNRDYAQWPAVYLIKRA